MSGYGQLAYLTVPPAYASAAASIHMALALQGLIVLDAEPRPADDASRAKLAALEKAKVRRVDVVAVVHLADGSLDDHAEEVVQYATDLGKHISHLDVGGVQHV